MCKKNDKYEVWLCVVFAILILNLCKLNLALLMFSISKGGSGLWTRWGWRTCPWWRKLVSACQSSDARYTQSVSIIHTMCVYKYTLCVYKYRLWVYKYRLCVQIHTMCIIHMYILSINWCTSCLARKWLNLRKTQIIFMTQNYVSVWRRQQTPACFMVASLTTGTWPPWPTVAYLAPPAASWPSSSRNSASTSEMSRAWARKLYYYGTMDTSDTSSKKIKRHKFQGNSPFPSCQ